MNPNSVIHILPAPAETPERGETEILRLFRKYRELLVGGAVYPDDTDEVLERLFYREAAEVRDRIMALPSACATDLAAKLLVATLHGFDLVADQYADALLKEARSLMGEAA